MNDDWEFEVDRLSAALERRLVIFFTELKEKSSHQFIAHDASFARDLVLRGGKRIMAASSLLSYRGFLGSLNEETWELAVGLELWRHSILVHDDVVDRDDMRRGGPSFHLMSAVDRDSRFGEANALFYGSALTGYAMLKLLQTSFDEKQQLQTMRRILYNMRDVNESQILDLLFEYSSPDEQEWYTMAQTRAASLFKMALGIGSELGGASVDDVKTLEEAGIEMGYAFDIQDDIIGTFSTEDGYGRPLGGDLELCKKPLYIIMAQNHLRGNELKALNGELSKKRSRPVNIGLIKELVESCGALKEASKRCKLHSQKAIDLINTTTMNPDEKNIFNGLIDYVSTSLEWYR